MSALGCRLDSGVDWSDLITWASGQRPAFAGKYFIGDPWRWVHGEGTALVDPAVAGASLAIAPIQASDPIRQAETGDLGRQWGDEDGNAVAGAIAGALEVGDLVLGGVTTPVYVYLEVAATTALSPDYWAAWAAAVTSALVVGKQTGNTLPLIQSPLPCVATTFAATPDGHWQTSQPIRDALDASAQIGWESARCYGFWATTPDPATIVASPALNWSSFAAYLQIQRTGPPAPVPVTIWRYATGNPAAPIHQVGKLALEATQAASGQPDPVLKAMLGARTWTSSATPSAIGVDRGGRLSKQISCLSRRNLTVAHLPEASNNGGVAGPALPTPLSAPAKFVGRYYSAGPQADSSPPPRTCKDLSRIEAGILSRAGVDIVSIFQARVLYDDIPAYLATPGNGHADACDAGWFAATQAHQSPHTAIYFAIDCDVTTSGVSAVGGGVALSDKQLVEYFTEVQQGLSDYLASQANEERIPYAVGVYSCAHAFDVLYPLGLASHFWQARPGTWGDAAPQANSNRTAWARANLWQVSLDDLNAQQTSSGLLRCGVTWILQVNNQPGPAQIQVTVGAKTTSLAYPPTTAALAAATGADVCIIPLQGGLTNYQMDFSAEPVGLNVQSVGAAPAGFTMGLGELPGLADLDVSWGDPGGWRAPRDGA